MSSTFINIDRNTLAERILDKKFMLETVSQMAWHPLKASTIKRVANELYALVAQLQNMR